METRQGSILKRMIFALVAGIGMSGCAVYAPPYSAYTYDTAPAGAAYYSPYSYGGYSGYSGYSNYRGYGGYGYSPGYTYGYPAYTWPPVSLNFGYYHSHRSGPGWRGHGYGSRNYGGYRGGGRGRR